MELIMVRDENSEGMFSIASPFTFHVCRFTNSPLTIDLTDPHPGKTKTNNKTKNQHKHNNNGTQIKTRR